MKKIAIFGYSGFASEIADICDALNVVEIVYLSEIANDIGEVNGIKVVAEARAQELAENEFKFSIGIASPVAKRQIYQKYKHLIFVNLIHPSATFGRGQLELVAKSKGLVIAAGARFMSGIELGDFVAIGLNATIGHDCNIGSYTSIMPGANISGNIFINEEVFIGSGAVILQGSEQEKLSLSKSLTVGAGAVVTKSFSEGGVLVGVPAREMNVITHEKK